MAAELPSSLHLRLAAAQEEMRSVPLPVRWVRPEGIHLTLKFLGEAAEARLAAIREALAGAGRGSAPFRLQTSGAVAYPERGAPRLIWVEIRGEVESARRLAGAIDTAMAGLGFAAETREFKPHLTLGRVHGTGRAQGTGRVQGAGSGDRRTALLRAGAQASGEFEVKEYVLFQSRLHPGGAVYTPLERFPLGA